MKSFTKFKIDKYTKNDLLINILQYRTSKSFFKRRNKLFNYFIINKIQKSKHYDKEQREDKYK